MSAIPTQTLLAQAVAPTSAFDGGLPLGADWGVSGADQASFENALQSAVISPPDVAGERPHLALTAAHGAGATLGESILNSLASVKRHGEAVMTEISGALSESDLSTSKLLEVQYRLMSMSIELQTTSNMAHHGVEDVKTIMRGQ